VARADGRLDQGMTHLSVTQFETRRRLIEAELELELARRGAVSKHRPRVRFRRLRAILRPAAA
jgi:hypothetical protein